MKYLKEKNVKTYEETVSENEEKISSKRIKYYFY